MAIGALLGLAGSVTTQIFGWLNRKETRKQDALRFSHEEKLWSHERELFVLQSQQKVAETEQEAFLTDVKGSWGGLEASINNQTEAMKGTSVWVRNTISMMRPVLTLIPLLLTLWASVYGFMAIVEVEEGTSALKYIQESEALLTLYGLTELTVTWWFGDRSIKRVIQNSENAGKLRGAAGKF